MTGLVEQLQADALDQSVSVATLLRKVKVAAFKLQLSDTVEWADKELKGYSEDVPPYRMLRGRCMALDPYRGWTVVGGDPELIEALSQRAVGQPISALEEMCRDDAGEIIITLSPKVVHQIVKGNPGCHDVALHITEADLVAVVDHVRNLVLDWAIDLARAGIKGEGLSFSTTERQLATASHLNINIEGPNARLNLGSVDASTNTIHGD